MFSDILWDFNGCFDTQSSSISRRFKINFEHFEHKGEILDVAKWYMVYELLYKKFSTAKRNFDGLIRFIKFVDKHHPYMENFREVDRKILKDYFKYLLNAENETTNKPLSRTSITKAALPVKDILLRGRNLGWSVPEDVRFVQRMYEEMIINNPTLKKRTQKSKKQIKDKVINQQLVDDIIQKAIDDLEKEENVVSAASVVIISQVGLRLSELLDLKTNCIVEIDGDRMLDCTTEKLESEKRKVLKPINELVELALEKMHKYSKPLRNESGFSYLFLSRGRGRNITRVSKSNFNKNFLRPWFNRREITDEKGRVIDFTAHTFRHIFATYALKSGVTLESVSKMMNHKGIRGTTHYAHLIKEEVEKRFSEVLSEGAVISGNRALTIKKRLKENNPFKGQTTDQVDKMRKAMKIQVLSHGICLHHPMRNEPCDGDGVCLGCDNYITTPDFLDIHKKRLKRVQDELTCTDEDGVFEAKLRHIESYLLDIINDLEQQASVIGK